MAASHVTISAFLELRDHMSAGVRAVSSEIDRLNRAARDAEDAIRRMRMATRFRPPPGPPAPPGRGTPGAPDRGGRGSVFGDVLRANLAVDALEAGISVAISGMSQLLKYSVKVGQEYENTQLRIANTLTSMNLAPTVQTAAAGATDVMSKLREMAAKLPGEAKDYYQVFAQGLPNAVASGMTDIKKYTDFAARYTATAISFGVDAPQAGRDLSEMLRGVATARTKTFQELRTFIGMTAKEFNKLAPEQKMATLESAVKKAGGGMSMAAETANAKFGELKSRVDEIFIVGGKPFFEGVKSAVSDLNFWLDKNKAKILEVAETVSSTLGRAFRGIETIVESIGNKLLGMGIGAGRTKIAEMSYKQADVRREQVRRLLSQSFGAADISPHKWLERTMLSGEYQQLTDRMSEIDKATRRVAETRQRFKERELGYQTQFEGRTTPPEVKLLSRWKAGFFEDAERMGFDSAKEAFDRYAESLGVTEKGRFDLWQELVKKGAIEIPTGALATREVNVNFNNNRFDIRQAFAEGFDPDRIAVAFASDLGRLGEFQMQSALAPYASVN